jgi:hypothetical protein
MTTANGGGDPRPDDLSPRNNFAVERLFFQKHYLEAPEIPQPVIALPRNISIAPPKNLQIFPEFTDKAATMENCVAWDGTSENLRKCDGNTTIASDSLLIFIDQPPAKATPYWIFWANEKCCEFNDKFCGGSSRRVKGTTNDGKSITSLLLIMNARDQENALRLAWTIDANYYKGLAQDTFGPMELKYRYMTQPLGRSLYEHLSQVFSDQLAQSR